MLELRRRFKPEVDRAQRVPASATSSALWGYDDARLRRATRRPDDGRGATAVRQRRWRAGGTRARDQGRVGAAEPGTVAVTVPGARVGDGRPRACHLRRRSPSALDARAGSPATCDRLRAPTARVSLNVAAPSRAASLRCARRAPASALGALHLTALLALAVARVGRGSSSTPTPRAAAARPST